MLSALHSKHRPDPPTPCIAQPLTAKLLRASCHGASNQNSLRGPHQTRPVFAVATRSALTPLVGHSARCLHCSRASRPAANVPEAASLKGAQVPGPPRRRPNKAPEARTQLLRTGTALMLRYSTRASERATVGLSIVVSLIP